MSMQDALAMGGLGLVVPDGLEPLGSRVLAGLVSLAEAAAERLTRLRQRDRTTVAAAVLGRLRGTGRASSFTRLIAEMERTHPLSLEYPFEGSDRVGGAVWIARELLGGSSTTSVAKLRWD